MHIGQIKPERIGNSRFNDEVKKLEIVENVMKIHETIEVLPQAETPDK